MVVADYFNKMNFFCDFIFMDSAGFSVADSVRALDEEDK
jgi:hypothetical protein